MIWNHNNIVQYLKITKGIYFQLVQCDSYLKLKQRYLRIKKEENEMFKTDKFCQHL